MTLWTLPKEVGDINFCEHVVIALVTARFGAHAGMRDIGARCVSIRRRREDGVASESPLLAPDAAPCEVRFFGSLILCAWTATVPVSRAVTAVPLGVVGLWRYSSGRHQFCGTWPAEISRNWCCSHCQSSLFPSFRVLPASIAVEFIVI